MAKPSLSTIAQTIMAELLAQGHSFTAAQQAFAELTLDSVESHPEVVVQLRIKPVAVAPCLVAKPAAQVEFDRGLIQRYTPGVAGVARPEKVAPPAGLTLEDLGL